MNEQICVGCRRDENEGILNFCNGCHVYFCINCGLECDNCPDYPTDYRFILCPVHVKIYSVSAKSGGTKKICDACVQFY
jgi:hypothetical protein